MDTIIFILGWLACGLIGSYLGIRFYIRENIPDNKDPIDQVGWIMAIAGPINVLAILSLLLWGKYKYRGK